jgi:hypothetical protein
VNVAPTSVEQARYALSYDLDSVLNLPVTLVRLSNTCPLTTAPNSRGAVVLLHTGSTNRRTK